MSIQDNLRELADQMCGNYRFDEQDAARLSAAADRIDALEQQHARITAELAAMRMERDGLRDMLRIMLKSAHPHPTEHPTMWAAWRQAEELLRPAPDAAHPEQGQGGT